MKITFPSVALIAFASLSHADSLPITHEKLSEIAGDQFRAHELLPNGVPKSYDWHSSPRVGAGLSSGAFRAFTGWGQAFWAGPRSTSLQTLQTRNFQSFICDAASRTWRLIQGGYTDGRMFDATYKRNESRPPDFYYVGKGLVAARFGTDKAYHFWPREGRASLPEAGLCGVVILIEAKSTNANNGAATSMQGQILLGLGADYWVSRTAPWDNYKTNRDLGIGRLKVVGSDWAWYGLALGSAEDLSNLARIGFSTTFEK